ncbi:MAG: efflux RND transporter periplasmic adaptor subunit [Bacteroidota bacterium]
MKNIRIVLLLLIGVLSGLGLGYILFHKAHTVSNSQPATRNPQPVTRNSQPATEYTCSMHPQIRQPEMGICPICEMDLIPVGEKSATNNDPTILEMTENAVKLANIQTTVIGQGEKTANKTIALSGKIQMDERRSASQVAHIPGRIEQLFVAATGEQISKGQKLATIYSPELITAQRELLEAVKFRDISPSLVDAAKNKLRFWKIADATIEQIVQNGKVQETFPLFAENSGIIVQKKVNVGDHLMQGQPLFEVMDLSRLWVVFDAYEEDLANIRLGNVIEFTTPALPNKIFKTKVTYIDPLINPSTRTAAVRTEINNTSRLLKPEMFVKGTLSSKSKTVAKAQLTVPKTAVMWTGKRSVVYTKVPDTEIPSYQFREVELGEVVGANYLVISGLENGEEVVTNGAFSIDAAAQLNNQRSMMNQEVKIKKPAQIGIPDFQAETPVAFKAQLGELTEKYIVLKDAFVATDPTAATVAATTFNEALKEIDRMLLSGEAHDYWMKKLNGLNKHSAKIAKIEEVEKQRKQFQGITKLLIPVLQAFGVEGTTIYIQHCPMAFDNRGADWLSTEEQIRNPYFGDRMMKCGSVTGTIAVVNDNVEIQ